MDTQIVRKKAWLVLQDGTRFEGEAFGAAKSVAGEAVFQTGMVGYPESLTDPSYEKQLLCLTYPMIGNYGVPSFKDVDEHGIPRFFESRKIFAAALIVADLSDEYSHWNASQSLSQWLEAEGVTGITGVDTRSLSKKLREGGSTLGKIVVEGDKDPEFVDPNTENLVAAVSTTEPKEYNTTGSFKIICVDVGLKYNQLRCLIQRGACVKVVPYNYDFSAEACDGIFISNGPGDPAMCAETITTLRKVLQNDKNTKPIFGICLGHQLLAIASGASTYKLPYGNRGHNQPCTHADTGRCFITSQNHGYAVNVSTLSDGWLPLFTNENDNSNEGIVHVSLPHFSVQFHPEANAGPQDTECLFDVFVERAKNHTLATPIRDLITARLRKIGRLSKTATKPQNKVVILGSGGLSIGQAGEFDYSGSQAIKALKEEGIQTVLINPNIATVQTMKGLADRLYFLPVTPDYVERVIEYERPTGVLLSFGGQTALNCGVELYNRGVFAKYDVEVLGTPVQAIVDTEDREIFSRKLAEINESCCPNISCVNVDEVVQAAAKIGYPVMMRSSFALGGLGSGVVTNHDQLIKMATVAFANSPQVTIEGSLMGWKEIEYEVVRDCDDNTITVCNMENFDPLGVHTGESIVVAPSQTLDDEEYNMLRNTAVKVVRHIGIVGECNIQYALDPNSRRYYIVEVNARLSRSSALASKATGYPLAYVAAKLALGKTLPKLRNAVTKKTTACFEPSLDYCVVKIPRWDLGKFPTVSKVLGTSMKSVGEAMAIGRTFEEAFQKALRMVDIGVDGLDPTGPGFDMELTDLKLEEPSERRPFYIAKALESGYTVDRIYDLSRIDKWFLYRCKAIVDYRQFLRTLGPQTLTREILLRAKQLGFADKQIATEIRSNELGVRRLRHQHKIRPHVKQIDTVAAEYPAFTNYLYLTYNGAEDDVVLESGYTIVLGSGVYRIGSSVEFDYCAVGCVRELRRLNFKTIMINYNPETVSTDYDECDRLYFDQLTFETVMDIYEMEKGSGIILSMGGQIPNNIAGALARENANILGTSPSMIDSAENRYKFSRLCDYVGIDQPTWKEFSTLDDAKAFAKEVGYPCLIRPSYILSGTAMRVAHSDADVEKDFKDAVVVSRDFPVVLSKFILDAKEIEIDAVAKDGELIVYRISEHVENAGVHSGDATVVHPAQDLTKKTMQRVKEIAQKIARSLQISGPFNIQFIAKDDKIQVIETNVRVSRSFPFVSKVSGVDMIGIATRVMVGAEPNVPPEPHLDVVGVKVAQFSFNRLAGADPTLGVDMISTGEVACFGKTREEAYVKAMVSTSFSVPKKKGSILLSIGGYSAKQEFLKSVQTLESLGYKLFGSTGTADFYHSFGVKIEGLAWLSEDEEIKGITDEIVEKKFDLIVNLPMRNKYRRPALYTSPGYKTRRMAVEHRIPLITNIKCAKLFVEALRTVDTSPRASPVDCQTSGRVVRLPGLIDAGLLITRDSATAVTAAAAQGGFTGVLALPAAESASPASAADVTGLQTALCKASFVDIGVLASGTATGASLQLEDVESAAAGLFVDNDSSFESVRALIEDCKGSRPLVVLASSADLGTVLYLASLKRVAAHVLNVRTKAVADLIVAARELGASVTCSAQVVDLFASSDVISQEDQAALWANLAHIDVLTTGHGTGSSAAAVLELALPLLLSETASGRITFDEIVEKLSTNPQRLFGIQAQKDTYVEVNLDETWTVPATLANSPSSTNLFAGRAMTGRVSRVVVRGTLVYLDGRFLAPVGSATPLQHQSAGHRHTVSIAAGTRTRTFSEREATRTRTISERETSLSGAASEHSDGSTAPVSRGGSQVALLPQVQQHQASEGPLSVAAKAQPGSGWLATPRSPLLLARKKLVSSLRNSHVLSSSQFTKDELHELFQLAHDLHDNPAPELLKGKILATVFYEPSTRTHCSFMSAMQRLGGSVISISDVKSSSVAKGESLADTVRSLECYADALVLRHPDKGAAEEAASFIKKPLINAGDGAGEHPTQALLDAFTIREELGTLNGLNITICGDLKNGRTVHSLVRLLSLYRVSLRYVAPESLRMPKDVLQDVQARGRQQSEHKTLAEVMADTDVLYVTRIQKERFADEESYEAVKDAFIVTPETLIHAKKNMIVMHPLPRVNEISPEVDTDPRAAYFRQMEHGVYIRMALLALVLGK